MRRVVMFAVLALLAVPVAAAAQQSVSLSIGGFSPRPESTRDPNDVLVNDLDFLFFNVSDLGGFTFGGEYLIALGDKFDAGASIGYFQKTAPAVDQNNEFEGTGAPIVANLHLRVVPITATFRFLPLGHKGAVQPYFGGGVAILPYRYTESGDFVSSDGVTIINGTFTGSGTAVGPVFLGGVNVPVGDKFGVGGELKYHHAIGELPTDQGFATASPGLTPQIDLGGWTYSFTVNFRF